MVSRRLVRRTSHGQINQLKPWRQGQHGNARTHQQLSAILIWLIHAASVVERAQHRGIRSGSCCVTLETINTRAGVGMTGLAKLASCIDPDVIPLFVLLCMTIQTSGQTILFSSDTQTHGLVSLMKQELHVVSTHNVHRFNTTLSFCCRQFWLQSWRAGLCIKGGTEGGNA